MTAVLAVVWFGEPIVPLLLPVVGTLGGVMLGRHLTRSDADREQRRAEYAALSEASSRLELAGLNAVLDHIEDTTAEPVELHNAANDYSVKLARIRPIASREVERTADELLAWGVVTGTLWRIPRERTVMFELDWMPPGGLPIDRAQWYPIFRKASFALTGALFGAIRVDLGIRQRPGRARRWWRRAR